MTTRNCQNCKQVIGSLEESYTYYGQVICKACMIKLEKQFEDTGTTDDDTETEIPIAEVRIEQDRDMKCQTHEAGEQATADLKKDTEHFEDKASSGEDDNNSAKKVVRESGEQALKAKGGTVLVKIAWILLVLNGLLVVGTLSNERVRDPAIQAFLTHPTPEAIGGTLGYLIGTNMFALPAFILSLVAWRYKKNRSGKVATIVSIVFMVVGTLLAFLPSSGAKSFDEEMLAAKQMSDEVVSMWDDINKGQPVKKKKIRVSEYGNATPFMQLVNDWITATQEIFLKMTTEMQQCNLASTCKPETLTDLILLSQSRLNLQKFKKILQSYEPQIKRLFNEFPQKVSQLDLAENFKQEAIAGYNNSKDNALSGILEFFEIENKIAAKAEELLDFMESKQGQVRYANNQLLFDSQFDADIYNSYIRDMTKLGEAEIAWRKNVQRQGFIRAEEFQGKLDEFLNDNEQPYYISQEHNFKVRFPGEADTTDYGMATHYTSEVMGEAAYNIFVNKHPKAALSGEVVNAVLEGYLEGRLSLFGDKAKLIESNHIYFRGFKALEYEYTAEVEGYISYFKGTYLLVGELGYNISVVCAKQTKAVAYPNFDRFKKSFQLTNRDRE